MKRDKPKHFSPHAPLYAVAAASLLAAAVWEYSISDSVAGRLSAALTVAMASLAISSLLNSSTTTDPSKRRWYPADAPAVSKLFFFLAFAIVVGSVLYLVLAL